jgi:hypothetical protein
VKCLLFVFLVFAFKNALAAEQALGEFSFSEFSLGVEHFSEEPGKNEFKLKDSFLKTKWSFHPWITGQLAVGSPDLTEPAVWFPNPLKTFTVTEAYAHLKTVSFDLQVGLLKIPVGVENFFSENQSLLPNSQVSRERWLIKRDLGIKTLVEYEDFQTTLVLHNGESTQSKDAKSWVTGTWAYAPREGLGFLLSAQVGNTTASATSGSVAQSQYQFVFDPEDSAKIRWALLSLFQRGKAHRWSFESGHGEVLQKNEKNAFAWGRFDGAIAWQEDSYLLLRYEQTQTHLKLSESIKKYASLGLSWVQPAQLASVAFLATKVMETPEVQNDQFVILFRLGSGQDR